MPADDPSEAMHAQPPRQPATEPMALADRRRHRVELPDCPSCRVPLQVDIRSSDTLYARCQWCGHRRMVAKPAAPPR